MVDDMVVSLADGIKVALGFECPLWVPVPEEASALTAGRVVDGNKAWSAGAGASVLDLLFDAAKICGDVAGQPINLGVVA